MKSAALSCTVRGMEPRRGTPSLTMWPDFQSDARPLDTGLAPRRNTEGGTQPADKELDQPSSQALHLLLCAGILPPKASILCGIAVSGVYCSVSTLSLDHGHKS